MEPCLCGHPASAHNDSGPCLFEGGCGCKAYDEAAPEPPRAWRASTLRTIAALLDSRPLTFPDSEAAINWLNNTTVGELEKHAAFLRQEADRIDGGEK